MRNSWRQFFRRLSCSCLVAGSAAWSSALCYAQIAADVATDPAYADGWTAGDNGGSGFTPWNFDGTYATDPPGQQRMDDGLKAGGAGSSVYNNLGRAWTLFNPVFSGNERDIAQAGRGFAPLQVGQTIRAVVDNPSDRLFFRGYTLKFVSGGESSCYGGLGCTSGEPVATRLAVGTFDYFTYGRWYPYVDPEDPDVGPMLFDTDTDQGVRIDVTLTSPDTFDLVMTPLDGSVPAYMVSGDLEEGGPIDWLEFEFYNTLHNPAEDTDFFIRSIEIIGAAPPGVPGDYNADGTVNAADYVVWRNGGPLQNEVPGVTPGTVTPEDYDAWKARFGNTSGAGGGSAVASSVVPEPGGFVLLVVGILGVAGVGARRSKRRMP